MPNTASVSYQIKQRMGLLGDSALLGQLSLFAIGSILMDHALGGGHINRADSLGVGGIGSRCVTSLESIIIAAQGGLQLRLHHTIAEILLLGDLDPFDRGLNVCQVDSPPFTHIFTRTQDIVSYRIFKCKRKIRYFSAFSLYFCIVGKIAGILSG